MGLMGRYYGKGLKKRKKAKLEGIVEDCKERKVWARWEGITVKD